MYAGSGGASACRSTARRETIALSTCGNDIHVRRCVLAKNTRAVFLGAYASLKPFGNSSVDVRSSHCRAKKDLTGFLHAVYVEYAHIRNTKPCVERNRNKICKVLPGPFGVVASVLTLDTLAY